MDKVEMWPKGATEVTMTLSLADNGHIQGKVIALCGDRTITTGIDCGKGTFVDNVVQRIFFRVFDELRSRAEIDYYD